jgi:integrase
MISLPSLSLADFFQGHYSLEKTLCELSVQTVSFSLSVFDRWHGSPVLLSELQDSLINRFVVDQTPRLSPRTVKRQRDNVLAVWRYAADPHGLCEPPRRIRPVRIPRRIPDAWTLKELRRMIDAAKRAEGVYPCGIKIADYWELFIRAGYDTGLRLSDLMSLPVDVLRAPTFQIVQSKTQVAIRKRFAPATIELAKRTLTSRELLLPWCFGRDVIGKHWKKFVLRPAGLPTGRREGPQKMRRTSASHLEAAVPGSARFHLGHSTPGLAEKHYLAPDVCGGELKLPPELD